MLYCRCIRKKRNHIRHRALKTVADRHDPVGGTDGLDGVGGSESPVRRLKHGQIVGVVPDAEQGPAAGEGLQLPGHGSLVRPFGGELHEMIAGVDHLIPLPPALPLHEVPQPHQPGHLRDEQSLGQRPGNGLFIQRGDLLEPQPRELGVADILLGGVQGADTPIRQIYLHGSSRKGLLYRRKVLRRALRQEAAQDILLRRQVVQSAAVVHDHRGVDVQSRRRLPESAQRTARGDGEPSAPGDPAVYRLQIPGGEGR